MRSETTRKGEIAKCKVLLRSYEKGIAVSVPTVDCDYDLIIDQEGKLHRVQVKYAAGKSGASGSVLLNLRRTTRNKKVLVYEAKNVDAILVYLPATDRVVWLPPKLWAGKTSLTIRYEPTKNNQAKVLLNAKDYFW